MIPLAGNAPLPYAIEYAKASRSYCKRCERPIKEGTLRMTKCRPAAYFDSTDTDAWYHFPCFWSHLMRDPDTINVASVHGVDRLMWDDQKLLRAKIQAWKDGALVSESPEPGSEDGERKPVTLHLSQLKAEKSATNRGKCSKCSQCFERGETKVSLAKTGGWCHAKCFLPMFDMVYETPESIPTWQRLDETWRQKVTDVWEALPAEKKASSVDVDEEIVVLDDATPQASSSQNQLKREAPAEDVRTAASEDVTTPEDEAAMEAKKRKLDKAARLAELRSKRMEKQANRLWELRLFFETMSMEDKIAILKFNKQDAPEGNNADVQATDHLVDIAYFGSPIGCLQCSRGKIVYNSTRRIYVCTGYATEYSKCTFESPNPIRTPFKLPDNIRQPANLEFNESSQRLYMAEENAEEVTRTHAERRRNARDSEQFIYAAEAFDSNNRLPMKLADLTTTQSTHLIKNGTLVDAKCPRAGDCHVFKDVTDGSLFQATLSFTDITQNKNSYFKIQLLKHDTRDVFYLFQSWGRVGTEVGDQRTDQQKNESEAVREFQELFRSKTRNDWNYRKYFRKIPGAFNYIETDFSEFERIDEHNIVPGSRTLLPTPVKELVMSIFDVENMKSALKSFEMDVNKMPLGRLSANQINVAFGVLTELSELLAEYPVNTKMILDATNKFYTIIPHNFGMKVPEPIDSFHKVKEKNNMLTALLDIKFAYDQIYGGDGTNAVAATPLGVDPVDTNYRKLKCELVPLEKGCRDWQFIAEYMKNTRGSTHEVNVDLIDILKVERAGESSKFMSQLGNRKLLWHGSGKMNFAGILGQGLRIAPPEAPVSGYMFGKGVYFADMFSKSFFYCRAHQKDEEAYILLCDVALGEMWPLLHATTVCAKTLPPGMSSVKGLGRECPCEKGDVTHEDGYLIPKGTRKVQSDAQYSLRYNEYIVYNVNQVQLKYLVRVKVHGARHL